MTRRTFTKEFKLTVLRATEHKPLAEISREFEVHPSLVTRWKREQLQYPGSAFKGRGHVYKLEAQLAEKDRLIGQLYAENALLKKTAALERERRAEEKMLRSTK